MPIYQVTVENNISKVITVMYVFAPTEETARANVSLNGWAIKGIKKLSEQEKAQITLSDEGLGGDGKGKIIINSFEDNVPQKDVKSIPLVPANPVEEGSSTVVEPKAQETPILEAPKTDSGGMDMTAPDNISLDNASGPLTALPMTSWQNTDPEGMAETPATKVVDDNLNILPDSPELEYVLTLNFDFSEIDPKLNTQLTYRLKQMPADRKYIIFGHADEVIVGKNAKYKNNYTLSYMRAEEVKKLMVGNGIAADNIKTVGLGIQYPLEDTKGSSLANRRAEIYGFRTQK